MTPKVEELIRRGGQPGFFEGLEEDMYCLGLTIIFALTGKHPTTLPKHQI